MYTNRELVKAQGVKISVTRPEKQRLKMEAEKHRMAGATLAREAVLNFLPLMELYPGEPPAVVRAKIERLIAITDIMEVNKAYENTSRQSA